MSANRFRPAGVALALGVLSVCRPAAAQQPARPPGEGQAAQLPSFGEVIDVRVINLEAVVTRRGERVAGLRAQDFSLRVDGEVVPIEFFTEVASGRAAAVSDGGRGAFPSLEPGAGIGTDYLIFIDDDFAIPSSRNEVLEGIVGQLGELAGEDRVAVVAYDGRRLELLSGWTRSLARLCVVLDEAQERRAYGMLRRSELRSAAAGIGRSRPRAGSSFSGTGFLGLGRAVAGARDPAILRYGDSYDKISQVVRAASSTLRAMASTSGRAVSGLSRPGLSRPGRKVMLLLAGGWPAHSRWGDRDVFDRLESERRLFAPLIEAANRLGYTVYPVDVQGGTYDTVGVAAEFGTLAAGRLAARGEQTREWLSEDALYHLAEQTGGRAILGGGRLSALGQAIEDTRSYYWLGFTPAWRGDGEEHRVEVEARPPGLKVRARASFSDLSRQNQVSTWIESAHLFDAPLPGSLELAVELGEPRPAGLGKILLPLSLEVPLDQVTVLPVEDGFAARLELRVAATDRDGASADIPVSEVFIPSIETPEPGQVGVYDTRLQLRRKPHRLLISLHDPVSGKVLAKRIEFSP